MSCCKDYKRVLTSEETGLEYDPKFREHGIRVMDGGSSVIGIKFCPWCGEEFPGSLRDAWFDRLEELGLDADDPNLPAELRSDSWWNRD